VLASEELDHLVEAPLDPAEALVLSLTSPASDVVTVPDALLELARELL
jgi:hypothetical protein